VTALIDVVGLCGGQTLKGVRLIVGNGRHKTTLSFPRLSQGGGGHRTLPECGEVMWTIDSSLITHVPEV
jgi:hypothetical protein